VQRVNFSDIFTGRSKAVIPPALAALCDALKTQSELLELDISDNAFGPVIVASFSDLLLRTPSLRKFRINNTGLGPEGGCLLAEVFSAVVVRSTHIHTHTHTHTHTHPMCTRANRGGGGLARTLWPRNSARWR
jgi:Ran GTPase-activating protein (RanGAP) involved in mRNA processing and transport